MIAVIMIAVTLICATHANRVEAGFLDDIQTAIQKTNDDIDKAAKWFFTTGEQVTASTLNSISFVMAGLGAFKKEAFAISELSAFLASLLGKEEPTLEEVSAYFNENLTFDESGNIHISDAYVRAVKTYISNYYGSGNPYWFYYHLPTSNTVYEYVKTNYGFYFPSQTVIDSYHNVRDKSKFMISTFSGSDTRLNTIDGYSTLNVESTDYFVASIFGSWLSTMQPFYIYTKDLKMKDSNSRHFFRDYYNTTLWSRYVQFVSSETVKRIRVFYSDTALKDWAKYNSSCTVYYSNRWYEDNDNMGIVIHGDVITNNDWSTINNNYYNNIDNSVTNYYNTYYTQIPEDTLQEIIESNHQDLMAMLNLILEEIGKKSEEEIANDNKNTDKIVDAVSKGAVHVADTIDKNSGNILNLLKEKLGLANSVLVAISDQLLLGFTRVNDNLNNLLGITSTVNAINDMLTAIQQKLDTLIASVDGISKIAEGIKKVTEPEEGSFWSDVLKFIGIVGGILAGGALAVAALEALAAMVAEATLVFQPVAALAKTKFPFSIPFDMVLAINILAAEPKAPVFKLPLKIESIGFYQDLVIDLGQFSVVSEITRTFFTIIFISCLIVLSRKLFLRR